MLISKYQQLIFNNSGRFINNGSDLIANGKFDTDLSNWIADNFTWSGTHAEYQWINDCYRGRLTQENISFAKGKYRLRFRYRALSPFELYVSIKHKTNFALNLYNQNKQTIQYDGLWHEIEIELCSIDAVLNDIIFECRSIYASDFSEGDFNNDYGGDFYGACLDTGHEEDGFFIDDVSIYKQIELLPCDFLCSEVIMDSKRSLEFQVVKERYDYVDVLTFDKNPYNPINATALQLYCDFFTKPSFAVNVGDYFVLYVGQKIYAFVFGTTFAFPYQLTIDGDFNMIEIALAPIAAPVAMEYFLQTIFDINHNTTSQLIAPPLTLDVQNIPSGSFFQYAMQFDSITGINPIGIATNNFVYEGGKLCYRKLSNGEARIYTTINAVEDFKYTFLINYNSSFSDFTNAYLDFYDGVNHVVVPFDIEFGSNETIVEFIAPSTNTYTVFLNIEDNSNHNKGFCIESFQYATEEGIKVYLKDCEGNITEVEFLEKKYKNKSLIQIDYEDFPENGMQVIVHALQGETGCEFISQPIKLMDIASLSACILSDLLRIRWSDNCYFGDLDYSNLDFVNEWFIQGFTRRINSNNKSRVQYVNTDGTISTIFNHSLQMNEVRVGVYSIEVHEVLEQAFNHAECSINDVLHFVDSGNYTLNQAGKGYTARIDLAINGKQLIKNVCC